jgi:hypothetical protein
MEFSQSDNMQEQVLKRAGWGGYRAGGGRPSGSRNFTTQMREAMIHELQSRTYDVTNNLFLAQLTLALGYNELWKIEKELVVGPRGGQKYVKKRPVRVTDSHEIEEYLISVVEGADPEHVDEDDPEATYFYIVKVPPNNAAIESLQERVLGKVPQKLGVGNPDGSSFGEPSELVKALTTKLNEIHGTGGVGGDGAAPGAVDAEAQRQD